MFSSSTKSPKNSSNVFKTFITKYKPYYIDDFTPINVWRTMESQRDGLDVGFAERDEIISNMSDTQQNKTESLQCSSKMISVVKTLI